MRIHEVKLYHVKLPMKFVFKTAKAAMPFRETLILQVIDASGQSGYGECVSFTVPFYTAETLEISKEVLIHQYLPEIMGREWIHPFDIHQRLDRKYPMAIAGIENALLDLYTRGCKENIVSLIFKERLRQEVEIGMVLGDLPSAELENEILRWKAVSCHRFKIKIKPSDGLEKIKRLVCRFPELSFLVDANKSFKLSQLEEVARFDELGLLCIEEPFAFEKIEECRGIQNYIKTPICMDESIQTMADLEKAYLLKVFNMLNVKIGRLGGLFYAKQMIDFCREKGIGFWIGSMVESGISKILHIQLAGLLDVAMTGDLSDSERYFETDLITPAISFINGKMKIPEGAGLGVEIDQNVLAKYTMELWTRSMENEFN